MVRNVAGEAPPLPGITSQEEQFGLQTLLCGCSPLLVKQKNCVLSLSLFARMGKMQGDISDAPEMHTNILFLGIFPC